MSKCIHDEQLDRYRYRRWDMHRFNTWMQIMIIYCCLAHPYIPYTWGTYRRVISFSAHTFLIPFPYHTNVSAQQSFCFHPHPKTYNQTRSSCSSTNRYNNKQMPFIPAWWQEYQCSNTRLYSDISLVIIFTVVSLWPLGRLFSTRLRMLWLLRSPVLRIGSSSRIRIIGVLC